MRNDPHGVPHELNQHLARRLKAARLIAGVSQQAAGDALGVTFQQIQKYEKGVNRVSLGSLAVLANVYRKPLSWFFEDIKTVSKGRDEVTEFMALPNAAEVARHYGVLVENEDREGVDVVLGMLRRLAKA